MFIDDYSILQKEGKQLNRLHDDNRVCSRSFISLKKYLPIYIFTNDSFPACYFPCL